MKFSKTATKPGEVGDGGQDRLGPLRAPPTCAMRPGCSSSLAENGAAGGDQAKARETVERRSGPACSSCR